MPALLLALLPARRAGAPAARARRCGRPPRARPPPRAPVRRPSPNRRSPSPCPTVPPAGRRLSADQVLAIAERVAEDARRPRQYPGSYGGAYLKGAAPLAGELLHAQRQEGDRAGDHRRRLRAGRSNSGPGFRSRGRWRAATRARSAGTSTRCTCGCRCACCSCSRSSTCAGRSRCCTWTCSCCCRSRCRSAFFNHAQHLRVGAARLSAAALPARRGCLRCCAAPAARTRSRRPLRLLVPDAVAGARGGVPARLSHRLNVTDSNVIDVGYAGRDRRQRIVDGKCAVRRLPVRQRTRRHLRPRQLRDLRPLRADLRLERDVGRPARRPRRRDLLRPARASACCSCSGGACAVRRSAIALAYAWVAYPFTLYALESNSNDTLVARAGARGAARRRRRRPRRAARWRRSPA